MTTDEKIAMLRQMRYVAAAQATGGRDDKATTEMIRAHQAIEALAAVAHEGLPVQSLSVDVDGHPLDPQHSWNSERSPAALALEKKVMTPAHPIPRMPNR